MGWLLLGYFFVVLCSFDGTVARARVEVNGEILRREKALVPLGKHFNIGRWSFSSTHAPEPEFVGSIPSIKIVAGRDAVLKCVVENLGEYKVTWRDVHKKKLLSMGAHVLTDNERIQVTTSNYTSWFLHIKNVTQEDIGYYACQINTQTLKSQAGYLDVVVPPEFVPNMTNRNVTVKENSNVTLVCRATGNPPPIIKWKREDGQPFLVSNQIVREIENEELIIIGVSRQHMAAYLCLASNDVPPPISRRIYLDVMFPPLIWVQNQLVGAPESSDISLECHTEAHPTSDNYWLRDEEPFVSKSSRYQTHISRNSYKTYMKLTIRNLQREDYGSYQCVAKNEISETQGSIRLHRLLIPTSNPPKPVTVEKPHIFPTRKIITVSVTTEYKTLITEVERRENTNSPGRQQKFGDGRVVADTESAKGSVQPSSVSVFSLTLVTLMWLCRHHANR